MNSLNSNMVAMSSHLFGLITVERPPMSSYGSNPYIFLALHATTGTLCAVLVEEVRDTSLYCLYVLGGYMFIGGLEHRVKD